MSLREQLDAENPLEDRLGRIADLLERSGIPLEEVGSIKQVRLNEWDGFSKDNEGNPQITPLTGAGIVLTPKWAEGPEWPVVQQAKPTTIRPLTTKRKAPATGMRTAVILPDPQIGYRRILTNDGEILDPFHDDTAIAVAMQIIRQVQPDVIINLGDMLDLAEFGRFEQEPGFALTTQASLDYGHEFLARQRANAPGAEIRLIEGNHDRRIQKSIINNAKAAFALRQASTTPDTWPVMSVPHLLRLDDLGVEYVQGYPAGITWLNDRLACIHGHKVRSAASTAAAVVDDERMSVIFGHVHRIELQHRTRRTRGGPKFNLAATPGCLSRIDGAVPSTKGSTDVLGRPIESYENWQQGVAVVTYTEGDGPFHLELIPIHQGHAIFRGQEVAA